MTQTTENARTGAWLIIQWARCWSSHDLNQMLDLCTDDIEYEDLALPHQIRGKQQLEAFFRSTLVTFPDFSMQVSNIVANDSYAAGEWLMSGSFLGESFGDAPTGKGFRVPGCCVMRIQNGRIRRHRDYWNLLTFNRQVGVPTR